MPKGSENGEGVAVRIGEGREPGAWQVLAMLVVITALSQLYRTSLAAIAPELSRDLRLSPQVLGLAGGAFFVALGVLQLPLGVAFDRVGPRRTIGALTGVAVLGTALNGLAQDGLGLVAARALMGIGCAGSFMGAVVLCAHWFAGPAFTSRLSWVFALSNLGTLAAGTPMAAASLALGWRWSFGLLAALGAASGLLFHALVRDHPPGRASPRAGPEHPASTWRGVAVVWRTPGLPPLLAMHAFVYASVVAVLGLWAGPYLHDVHGLAPLPRGHVLALMGLAQVIGILGYGPLDRTFNTRKWIVVPGALTSMAVLGTLALWPRPPLGAAAALLVAHCLVTAYGVVIVAHGRSLFPDHLVGRGVTAVNLAQVAGTAALPIVSGAIMAVLPEAGGTAPPVAYRAVFGAIALALGAGLLPYLLLSPDAPPRHDGLTPARSKLRTRVS
jgi:predicted MFS family arabinose efflux permease